MSMAYVIRSQFFYRRQNSRFPRLMIYMFLDSWAFQQCQIWVPYHRESFKFNQEVVDSPVISCRHCTSFWNGQVAVVGHRVCSWVIPLITSLRQSAEYLSESWMRVSERGTSYWHQVFRKAFSVSYPSPHSLLYLSLPPPHYLILLYLFLLCLLITRYYICLFLEEPLLTQFPIRYQASGAILIVICISKAQYLHRRESIQYLGFNV